MEVVCAGKLCAHIEAAFRRELFDEPPHLSAADDGKAPAHAALRPVSEDCAAIRA